MPQNLNFTPPTPLAYFASLVRSDVDLPLLEAAASLAQDEEPGLDVEQVLDDVDRLLKRVQSRLLPDADGLSRLAMLTQVFHKELGFGLNVYRLGLGECVFGLGWLGSRGFLRLGFERLG